MAIYRNLHTPVLSGVNIQQTALAADIDTTMVSHGIVVGQSAVATIQLEVPQSAVWFHFSIRTAPAGGNLSCIRVVNTAGDVLIAFRPVSATIVNIEAFNVIPNTVVGQFFRGVGLNQGTQYHIDIFVEVGSFSIYVDGNLHFSISGLSQPGFQIDRCEFRSTNTFSNDASDNVAYSEFAVGIGANSSTVGSRVRTMFPTGNGALAAWATGGFANIDDGPVINDGVFATSNVSGNRSSYTVPVPTGNLPIETVQLFSSALHNGAGVTDYRHFARLAGINYDQGLLAPGLTLGQQISTLAISPATGLPWTFAELSALEIGIQSA
jgi:hypothetical protein